MKEFFRMLVKIMLRLLYIFPVNEKKVYLMNFNGDKYGLDAKAFAEYLKVNHRGEYNIFWETVDLSKTSSIEGVKIVGKYSLLGLYHYTTAGLILCNMTPRSYIPFRKKQVIINTWHGYPVKKVGKYAIRYNQKVYEVATCFPSHSKEYTDLVLKDSFEYDKEIICCGVPRNDLFFAKNIEEKRDEIKKKIGVRGKVLIFAPTFRGDYKYEEPSLEILRLQEGLQIKTKEKWTILFRLHPQLTGKFSVNVPNVIDVSEYPDMQELLLVSDILITDYSSCAWDFVQQKKPVILYVDDLQSYSNSRGLYFPLKDLPYPLAQNNDELMKIINTFDIEVYKKDVEEYFRRVENYEGGNACEKLLMYANNKRMNMVLKNN